MEEEHKKSQSSRSNNNPGMASTTTHTSSVTFGLSGFCFAAEAVTRNLISDGKECLGNKFKL